MRQKLTKKLVESLAPTQSDQVLWDSEVPGFGFKLTPSGKRSYFAYYRTEAGRQRKPKIGDHGSLTVDEARQIARKWLASVADGQDVSGDRIAYRAADTVAELATRYLQDYATPNKKPSSVKSDRANLENHVIPCLGSMKVRDVRRLDIENLKVAVREGRTARKLPARTRGRRNITGGQGAANRVIALVSKLFGCAVEWGILEANPARGIRKYREYRKDRYLNKIEVSRLLEALDQADTSVLVPAEATAAIRILLFTGMRTGEVLGLKWAHVDADQMCFRLEDSKTGARVIPYGLEVQSQLNRLKRKGDGDVVFSGHGGRALALRRPWYKVREAAEIDETATLHTLRHTFASWSVMSGLSLAQVGSLLGHKSPQTTLRYADHEMEHVRTYAAQANALIASLRSQPLETLNSIDVG